MQERSRSKNKGGEGIRSLSVFGYEFSVAFKPQ